jgi:hypothetical protein
MGSPLINRPQPESSQPLANQQLQTRGMQQSAALANTSGAMKDYMAARGAAPISGPGGLGTTRIPMNPAVQPVANATNQALSAANPNAKPGMASVAAPPTAGAAQPPVPKKGRTTSMQRRGVGVGQPPGQQRKPNGNPLRPMAAAQQFLAKPQQGGTPKATPIVGSSPGQIGPAPPSGIGIKPPQFGGGGGPAPVVSPAQPPQTGQQIGANGPAPTPPTPRLGG